jgi:glycine cleavage system H protein
MRIPQDRLYSEYHVWVQVLDGRLVIGLSEFACEELGEINYIELVPPGTLLVKDQPFGFAETAKAVTELYSPLSGEVIECNVGVLVDPDLILEDPYEKGRLLGLHPTVPEELRYLIRSEDYLSMVESAIHPAARPSG